MKMKNLLSALLNSLIIGLIAIMPFQLKAQTADEIIETYFENTGGREAWSSLKGIRINAKVNQGGLEIPLEIVQMADGRTYTKITFQGMTIMQGVYDGTTSWNTNFQTMKAEKTDEETTYNMALEAKNFPDAFLNYKEKGYTVELMGNETIDGAETFKIKLTKSPMKVDGNMVDNVSFYYFESENMVPIAVDTEVQMGPQKGAIGRNTMSDYQEVEGLFFPFAMSQGLKDGPSQAIQIESIELNPEIDEAAFTFPEQ